MSQDATGGVQANNPGATFRANLNTSLAAIITLNSGASAPTVTYAYMLWADTTTGLLKQRDSLNATWIVLGTMGAIYMGLLSLAGGNMTGAVNYARTTVASAAIPDIWTGTGNNINYTGTVAATGFAAAPQAGASRILDCAAAASFTAGANMLIDGVASGSNLTVSPGDRVEVFARTTTQFVLTLIPSGGAAALSSSLKGSIKNYVASAIGLNNYNVVVTADEVVLENSANQYHTARAVNLTINANGAVGAPLSIMSARAASTWYYIWLWYNATAGLTATLDASSTAPTAPTGYAATDYNARMPGAVRTDTSGSTYLLQTQTKGRSTSYIVLAGSNTASLPSLGGGVLGSVTTPTWSAMGVSAALPTAVAILCRGVVAQYNASGNVLLAPSNQYGAYNATSNAPPIQLTGATSQLFSVPFAFFLESTSIYYASNATNTNVQISGWEE